ncbi:MAG: hypothetical protein JST69_14655 [Bacteroidetes bacterium]|nr:hypothetical protein [Bacteroidota bacterium]
MLLTVTVSCHKSDVKKIGCGCNSDSIWHYVAYDNFGGYNNYNATMGYDTVFKRNAWFIGVTIPNTNYNASLKICNPEYVSVKAITDTIPKKNGIPVRGVSIVFSGKIKRLCSNENQCFGCDAYLPEILFGYLIIDSIKLAD